MLPPTSLAKCPRRTPGSSGGQYRNNSISRAPRKSGSNPSLCGGSPSSLMRCRFFTAPRIFMLPSPNTLTTTTRSHSSNSAKQRPMWIGILPEKATGTTFSAGCNLQNRTSRDERRHDTLSQCARRAGNQDDLAFYFHANHCVIETESRFPLPLRPASCRGLVK